MMVLHPGVYNLEKYEEFVANEVLLAAQRKQAKGTGTVRHANSKKKRLLHHFA
ncbi:MAG TPA: hypothetical protein GX521_00310 [Firmicutes bacterium]|nr:hypothetical protein [Bacillota bacterium]